MVTLGPRMMLQRPEGATFSAEGQREDTFENLGMVNVMDLRGIGGTERVRDNIQLVAEATHTMLLRWNSRFQIEPSWRLRGRQYYFEILSAVDLSFRQRMLFIQARIAYDEEGRT